MVYPPKLAHVFFSVLDQELYHRDVASTDILPEEEGDAPNDMDSDAVVVDDDTGGKLNFVSLGSQPAHTCDHQHTCLYINT